MLKPACSRRPARIIKNHSRQNSKGCKGGGGVPGGAGIPPAQGESPLRGSGSPGQKAVSPAAAGLS